MLKYHRIQRRFRGASAVALVYRCSSSTTLKNALSLGGNFGMESNICLIEEALDSVSVLLYGGCICNYPYRKLPDTNRWTHHRCLSMLVWALGNPCPRSPLMALMN